MNGFTLLLSSVVALIAIALSFACCYVNTDPEQGEIEQ